MRLFKTCFLHPSQAFCSSTFLTTQKYATTHGFTPLWISGGGGKGGLAMCWALHRFLFKCTASISLLCVCLLLLFTLAFSFGAGLVSPLLARILSRPLLRSWSFMLVQRIPSSYILSFGVGPFLHKLSPLLWSWAFLILLVSYVVMFMLALSFGAGPY